MNSEHIGPPVETETTLTRETVEIDRQERIKHINQLVPTLAYSVRQKLIDAGLADKVAVRAVTGQEWGVGVSKNNPRRDLPNVIVYPESILSEAPELLNARLRHEIGNLNYDLGQEKYDLITWAREHDYNPSLLLALVDSLQAPSVDYHEMKNSFSDDPAALLRPYYQQQVKIDELAANIDQQQPYKQALDLALLYCLSQIDILPKKTFLQAVSQADESVQKIFRRTFLSLLDQTYQTATAKEKVQLIRDFIWPKLAGLVGTEDMPYPQDLASLTDETWQDETNPITPSSLAEQNVSAAMPESAITQPPENTETQMSATLQEYYQQQAQDQADPQIQQERQASWQALTQNLQQEKDFLEQELTQATDQSDAENDQVSSPLMDQLRDLQEALNQLNDPEFNEADFDTDEPVTYQIDEIGIDEDTLSASQKELLDKIRHLTQKISRNYCRMMRLIMRQYQRLNPNFTDEIVQKMKDRRYDTPRFTIYSPQAGDEFLSQNPELGLTGFNLRSFLLNFNLPKLIGRFWYRGGYGKMHVPVPEGNVEWGKFYRDLMPVVWQTTNNALWQDGVVLHRLNAFGQHNHRQYYYLWQVDDWPLDNTDDHESSGDESSSGTDSDQSAVTDNDQEISQPEQQSSTDNNDGVEENSVADESESEQNQSSKQEPSQESSDQNQEQGAGQGQSSSNQSQEQGADQGSSNPSEQGDGQNQGQSGQNGEQSQLNDQGQGSGNENQSKTATAQAQLQQIQSMLAQLATDNGQQQAQARLQKLQEMMQRLQQEQSGSNENQHDHQDSSSLDDSAQELSAVDQLNHAQDQNNNNSSDNGNEQNQSGKQEPSQESSDQNQEQGAGQNQDKNNQRGGSFNQQSLESLFRQPLTQLQAQLKQTHEQLSSAFEDKDDSQPTEFDFDDEQLSEPTNINSEDQNHTIEALQELKNEQQRQLEAIYAEKSGLSGESLQLYTEYMESMQEFIGDLVEFFTQKFHLDQDYTYTRNQRRGARLQTGWTKKIAGIRDGRPLVDPQIFERKQVPKKPNFVWSIIIDNSGSCDGEIITHEIKTSLALMEVARRLQIPFELVTFGGQHGYTFLKNFDQNITGQDLAEVVLLQADQGTPDVATLKAACISLSDYAERYDRSYNFVYFMTDGESGDGNIREVIEKYQDRIAITGIGLGDAARSIHSSWGQDALAVSDVKQLTKKFIAKIQRQIDEKFD